MLLSLRDKDGIVCDELVTDGVILYRSDAQITLIDHEGSFTTLDLPGIEYIFFQDEGGEIDE